MASITMTTSFLGGSVPKLPTSATNNCSCRVMMVVKASSSSRPRVNENEREEKIIAKKRRDVVFAAAAAAAGTLASAAALAEEPKPGTPEAKKKYAPVCITMPTARICRN